MGQKIICVAMLSFLMGCSESRLNSVPVEPTPVKKPTEDTKVDQAQLNLDLLRTVDLGEPPERPFDSSKFYALIDKGAHINAQDITGSTVLLLAVTAHAYLPDDANDKQPLFKAIAFLVEKGADVNLGSKLGLTPLMMAVHRAYTGSGSGSLHPVPQIRPVYEVLLKSTPTIDLNIKSFFGQTALSYLIGWKEYDLASDLIRLGADVTVTDSYGSNLLFKAAVAPDIQILKDILMLMPEENRESLIHAKNLAGATPLMQATLSGRAETVKYITSHYPPSADQLNAEKVDGITLYELIDDLLGDAKLDEKTKQGILESKNILLQFGLKKPIEHDPNEVMCEGHNHLPFNYEKLERIVKQCRIQSLDALIPLLPKASLSNYSLVYDSRSLQGANTSHPRVVSMGWDGKFMLAFNGNPGHVGYNTLEMIQFKDISQTKKAFEFRELSFKNNAPNFSEANPSKCLSCHKESHPRPNWDTWYIWPGVYSSEDGAMYPQEQAKWATFLPNMVTGRYKNLYPPSDTPHRDSMVYMNYANNTKNLKMDQIMFDLNGQVIASDLVNESKLSKYKYALLGAVSCAEPVEVFLPATIQSQFSRTYNELYKETKELDRLEIKQRIARQSKIIPGGPEGKYANQYLTGVITSGQSYELSRVAKLRYLVEGQGLPMEWSTVFEEANSYVMFDLKYLEYALWNMWIARSNDVREAKLVEAFNSQNAKLGRTIFDTYGLFRGGDYLPDLPDVDSTSMCAELKKLSLSELETQ